MRSVQSLSLSPLLRYGVAVLSVVAVVAVQSKFLPHIENEAPFLLVLVPALLATKFGGLGPGVVAATLSTAAVSYLSLPPRAGGNWTTLAALQVVAFAFESACAVALVAAVQASCVRAEQTVRRIRSSYEASAALGRVRSAHEAAQVILAQVISTLGASGAAVFVTTDARHTLHLMAYRAPPWLAKLVPDFREVPLDSSLGIALVGRTRVPIFIENEKQWEEQLSEGYARVRERAGPQALLLAPMAVRDRLIGVLVVGFERRRRFGVDDRVWAQALAQDCARALDRTDLLEAEYRARAEAQEANRAKDEFLAVVSHELRAPLASISAWTDTLKQAHGKRELFDQGVEVIERSVEAQEHLIEALLDLSRVVARQLQVNMKRVELLPLVRASVDPLRIEAAAAGVDLSIAAQAEVMVIADADRLKRMIGQLVSHALHVTPPGGRVEVETKVDGRRVLVQVRDEADGVEPQGLAELADPDTPSARVAHTRMAIARYIVEGHRGSLRIERAKPGRGTTVVIDLPIADPASGLIGTVSPTGSSSGAARRLTGMRILLVADDMNEGDIIAGILTDVGAEVWSFSSTSEALARLRTTAPDLLVTDLTSASRDDFGFIRRARALPTPAGSVPALGFTGSSIGPDVEAMIGAGYQRCMPRPPEPRSLTDAVAALRPPVGRKAAAESPVQAVR
jgi:K+-sensing histidine kinase KdpD